MLTIIKQHFESSIETKQLSLQTLGSVISSAAALIGQQLGAGHKVLSCGNGGSAGDAQHFASRDFEGYVFEGPDGIGRGTGDGGLRTGVVV